VSSRLNGALQVRLNSPLLHAQSPIHIKRCSAEHVILKQFLKRALRYSNRHCISNGSTRVIEHLKSLHRLQQVQANRYGIAFACTH